jgi:cysteinyl-tRNA synthetase
MSSKYLGRTFDIHCGGVDNIFPHHENEIAQSEAAHGVKFVNFWLHCHHLVVDGEKMAKSKGNFYRLSDVLAKGYDPGEVRFLLLSTHYRKMLNFTDEALLQARTSRNRVRNFLFELRHIERGRPMNPTVTEAIETARAGSRKPWPRCSSWSRASISSCPWASWAERTPDGSSISSTRSTSRSWPVCPETLGPRG